MQSGVRRAQQDGGQRARAARRDFRRPRTAGAHALCGGVSGVRAVCAGAARGLAGAVWLSRFVAPLLYGRQPRDPATLGASAAILAAVAGVAAWIPARRAARLDPARALREH